MMNLTIDTNEKENQFVDNSSDEVSEEKPDSTLVDNQPRLPQINIRIPNKKLTYLKNYNDNQSCH